MTHSNMSFINVYASAEQLNIVEGVTVEIHAMDKHYLIAVYDHRDTHYPIQASWLCNEYEAVQKIREIQKRYGDVK